MGKCRWTREVERWFDGAKDDGGAISAHVKTCPKCAAHLAVLQRLRTGVSAVIRREEIRDTQFPAFIEGVRGRIEGSRSRRLGLWALSSIAAAALIVALFGFMVITGGLRSATAAQTVVESVSTDLNDASVGNYSSDNGTSTVWVDLPRGDVL